MLIQLIVGVLLTLLPERLRRRWQVEWHGSLRRSAVLSGLTQMLFCLGILIFRYPRFAASQMAAIDSAVFLKAAERGGDTAVQGFGLILLFAYVLTPMSLMTIYFVFEGSVRLVSALATGEVVGTLPLLLAEKAEAKWAEVREEKRQGPRVPDLISKPPVEGTGYELAVASCRAKPNWNDSMTVFYQDTLYEVVDYLEAAPPRRHVYLLRRAPGHKVVRGLHHYDPEEVLKR